MAWGKAGSDTLTSAGDNLDITSMTASKTNQFLVNSFYSGDTDGKMTFNDNNNSVYAFRRSLDGASDTTGINQVSMGWYWGTTIEFWVSYFVSVSGEEKLGITFGNVSGVTSGTAPHRMERVDKFVPSPDADITRIDRYNSDTGSFDTGSNITALGSDLTPASAIPFPTNVELGSRTEITDTRKIYYRMDSDYESTKWYELGTLPYGGGRGVFGGGYTTSSQPTDRLDYITIATAGNATDFGNLTQARYGLDACSNKTRGIFFGGSNGSNQTTIDFVTPATLGDATDFGDISHDTSKTYGVMALSSETRGVVAGGESGYSSRMDYVTIASKGNSTSFPNGSGGITTLTVAGKQGATTSDGTRGVFIGGEGRTPTMDYITIDTAGVCTDFADLRVTLYGGGHGLITDGTIGVFSTGTSYEANIDKITIAGTPSNSTNYGDMTTGRSNCSQCSDKTRGIYAGGKTASGSNYTNIIEFIEIATPATCTDFGDLSQARQVAGGLSDTGADRS